MNNSFRFKKGDWEIEFSGEKSFVEEQIKLWKNMIEVKVAESFSPQAEMTAVNDHEQNQKKIKVKKNITIDDFIKLKDPYDEVDKTIVAAYYLEKYEKLNSFTEIDVYRVLKLDNVDRYLSINLEKGYLSSSKSNNNLISYTLTYSGEVYVKQGLQ
jgi:hypothetical protein